MITHDCTYYVELVSFLRENHPLSKSGWFLARYFRDRRTMAEKLEFRKYTKTTPTPLFYGGVCLPPHLIKGGTESLQLQDLTFPVIKAETSITNCDIDERRITPEGKIIPVGKERFLEEFKYKMAELLESLRMTHISEAVSLLKTGSYVLHTSETQDDGTIDYGRAKELAYIDLTGTASDWCDACVKPMDTIAAIVREMGKHQAVAGTIDIIYSPLAWETLRAHAERDGIKFAEHPPQELYDQQVLGYADVQFMATTNGGKFHHWVSYAEYKDHKGDIVPVVDEGEIMIISKEAFDGQRIFRTVTSDNVEQLANGQNFFVYNDLDREYNRKCRSFNPWIEEYHIMTASNVNGAVTVKVVSKDCELCLTCKDKEKDKS